MTNILSLAELADLFGVADPSDIADDLYDDCLGWMAQDIADAEISES